LRLDEGMQILVGKNNAGKTAILRGLTALRGLPFDKNNPLPFHLGGYARGASPLGDFTFHVECSWEKGDFDLLGGQLEETPPVKNSKTRVIDFDFRLIGIGNFVGLQGATLNLDDRKIPLLVKEPDAWIQLQYDQFGKPSGRLALRGTSESRGSGVGSWPILANSAIFSALAPLKNVQMLDAHRVARPENNLQAVDELTPNAESLAPFLDTLSGNDRRTFSEVEGLLKRVFPELEFVNPRKRQNAVFLTLSKRGNNYDVPLIHCGTGVEQVLAMGAFVLTAPAGSILLLDEPHAYLHPSAEREIIEFLQEHSEHRYVISTHSAILINAVSPDRIFAVSSPKMTTATRQPPETATLLHSLGYKNSDFLFSDRLIFVEGESDQEILPILLGKNPNFPKSDIARTGFPKMDGEGKLRGSAKQTPLLFFEKFLRQLGKSTLQRIYLFDGDCDEHEREMVRITPIVAESDTAAIEFLPRCEIENYLLDTASIVQAIRHLAGLDGKDVSTLSEDAVRSQIQELLNEDNAKLFPNGKGEDPWRSVKGSVVLERVFASYELKYRKRNEGRLLAELVTLKRQPALTEIWDRVRSIFPTFPERPA